MTVLLVGYARVSTDQQDLTSQRDGLAALGVAPNRIYVDHGLTGTNRERRGLREALAACREGDTLVVTKLDRSARSLPDARAIADELTVMERGESGAQVQTQKVPLTSGGSGIRTHGGLHLTAFQEPRICPLCHPSERLSG